jgi:mono/diheme cytochrome c family protein
MKHKNQTIFSKEATMRKLIPALMLAGAFVLSACGGGASNTENTSNNPNNNTGGGGGGGGPTYTGPAPANAEIQAFRLQFWENVRGDNRCGTCHDVGGQGNSAFADNSNVNDAYAVANTLVDTTDIANSQMVRKFSVGTGHFCWESTQSACAAQLELWITNWLSDSAGSGGRGIVLTPPADENPAPVQNFDATVDPSYYTGNGGLTIHQLVTQHCSGCHIPVGATEGQPQSPFFAVADAQTSYDTVSSVPLINLNTTALSRLYERLTDDGHNCWVSANDTVPGDCSGSSQDMLTAINFYVNTINTASPPDTTELDSMLKSRAVTLFEDGITASGGNRFEASQIALYEFKLNGGDTVIDRSGVSPAANLTLFGNPGTDYEWLGSYGIRFMTPQAKAQASPSDSDKLHQMITSTGEYTVETWVIPGNVAQMDTNIVTYGRSASERNFALGQSLYDYEMFNRNISDQTNADATPLLTTNPAGEIAQAALQHVVMTYDPTNGRQVYVNGVLVDVGGDPIPGEGLANWATGSALALGNDVDFQRPWNGTIRLLALHNRALTLDQVRQNFDVGVGQKFYLMFEISQHLGPECRGPDPDGVENDPVRDPDYAPLCYIYLEAAQWDNKSFLFAYPRFINLDPNADPTGIQIQNMRIGVNGREASNGQGFANMNVTIDGNYDPASGQLLSNIGTIVALENGPAGSPPDQLFLTFERLASATPTKDYTESFSTTPDAMNPAEKSAVMIRSFEEINASMAKMTGVDRTIARVNQNNVIDGGSADNNGTYVKVKQGLPSSSDIQTFVPSQQMAITQLAIEYCNALVEDNGTSIPRATYFPGITFSASSPQFAFTGAERDLVIDPLLARVFNVDGATELSTMPAATTVRNHLYTLMDDLNNSCSGNCSVARSMTIIKSTCAAAVASAPMLLQ